MNTIFRPPAAPGHLDDVDRLVQCRGGFIGPGLADEGEREVALDDGLGLGAVLELPRGRFQDRGGVPRVAEEQVAGAREPAGLGRGEQVDRRVILADLPELPVGSGQGLLAALPFAEHGVCLGGVQHGQAGDDGARGARYLGGALAGREPGAGVLVPVERDHAHPQQGEPFRGPVPSAAGGGDGLLVVGEGGVRRTTALAYYDQAVTAARSRGDRAAEGLALLRMSMVALYGHKDARAGLAACQHTAEVAATASSVIAGLAVLHSAEAHAMLGERQSCEQALAAADRQFGRVSQDDPAIDLFSPAQPGRLAGSCYLFLGDARRAAPILEATARQLQDRSKAEAIVQGNLALAFIGQSRADEAAAALHQAIDVIEVTWGAGGLNIVFTAARQLRRWQRLNVVRDVSDRLLALMAAS